MKTLTDWKEKLDKQIGEVSTMPAMLDKQDQKLDKVDAKLTEVRERLARIEGAQNPTD